MTAEESNLAPLPSGSHPERTTDYFALEAHRIATLWAELPPEHFKTAVAAAKAESALRSQERVVEMRLRHEAEMRRLETEKETALAEAAARERAATAQAKAVAETAKQEATTKAAQLRHRRHVINVISGAVISFAMLGVAVYALPSAEWVSAFVGGPGVYALAKIFVLRKSDAGDMKWLGRGANPPPPL
ncbi:hypothetical protein [Streptomyces albogriseolus]|uniref:hypothetical protein n=1 Tax=Streptomyces albogriseolus TaxID=1887 RepID=UPI003CEE497C